MKKILFILMFVMLLSFGFISAAWTPNLNKNLIHYYSMDEGTGNVVEDLRGTDVGEQNNGTTNPNTQWVSGILGNAVNSTADVGIVTMGSMNGMNNANYSISLWVNTPICDGGDSFLASDGIVSNGNFDVRFILTDGIRWISDNDGGFGYDDYAGVCNVNAWIHVVLVSEGNSQKLYTNGTLRANTTSANGGTEQTSVAWNNFSLGVGLAASGLFGAVDEVGVWNRSLSASEISDLYNGGVGITYSVPSSELTISLDSPEDNAQISEASQEFNSTLLPTNLNLTNATIYVWNSNGSIYNTTTNILTGDVSNATSWNISGYELGSIYNWNVFGCGENATSTLCNFAPANYTFTSSVFSVTNVIYNVSVIETDSKYFLLNISANPLVSSASAVMWYNGSSYSSTVTNGVSGIYNSINTIDIPLAEQEGNKSFFWEWTFTLTNGNIVYQNSTTYSHLVNRTYLTFCNATYVTPFVNFTSKNAENPFPILNVTFKSAWSWWLGSGDVKRNYSFEDVSELNNSWDFCVSQNKTFYVDGDFEYDATDYAKNFYYLSNASISNVTNFINLYLLNDSKATVTEIIVYDQAQTPEQDVIIQIQLYDIGKDTYYTVSMGKTSFDGKDLAYLNWYDTLYKFIFTRDGVVLKTTEPYKISESPQIFTIEDTIAFSFDKFKDFIYSLTFNNATNNFVLTFTKPSGLVDQGCLRVISRNSSGDTEICLTCESSNSATLYCNIGNSGNGTFIAAFYATGSWKLVDWIFQKVGGGFAETIYDLLGDEDATAYAFLMSGVVTSVFLINPVFGIVGIILGILAGAALGFTLLNYTTFLGIVIVGGIIIWVVNR